MSRPDSGRSATARAAVLEVNRRVIAALNIHWGITHLEAYLTPTGLLFGEIALRPPGGYIMELVKLAYGFNAWRAFVAMELDLPFGFTSQPRAHTAAVVIHPGAGTVTAVHGVEEIRSLAEVTKARVRVRPGDMIAERVGIGSDVGHIACALTAANTRGVGVSNNASAKGYCSAQRGGIDESLQNRQDLGYSRCGKQLLDDRRVKMTQTEANKVEWQNPDNWSGPKWLSVYFSKKDTRTWVPKQIPPMGWTINLGKTAGILWPVLVLVGLPLPIILVMLSIGP